MIYSNVEIVHLSLSISDKLASNLSFWIATQSKWVGLEKPT